MITTANTISYYHTDHLGTPQELTDATGQIVWEAAYATWGNTAKVSYKKTLSKIDSQEAVALQPLRFQGQYYDAETGLHYNRFRYYDPDIGRFTSQDPIGLLGGDNLYAYAPNPMAWVDPLGLSKCGIGKKSKKKWTLGSITKLGRQKIGNYQVEVHVDERGPHIHIDRGSKNEQYINADNIKTEDVMKSLPGKLKKNKKNRRRAQ